MDGRSGALGGRRILLCVTGGIAAYKAAGLARLLVHDGADVTVLMTPTATRFVGPDTFAALSRNPVHTDLFERPETVAHVRLAHDADAAVVAPATANVLAKLALGLADDLVTSTLLEATCPIVIAPAMHTGMWNHPATRSNLRVLAERGVTVVGPVEGALAAGDEGVGRMAEPEQIAEGVRSTMSGAPAGASDLTGTRVLVTAGPTHEPIDPVRFIGNRSTGKMGFAIAVEAARRGAAVTLVRGPVALPDPAGVEVVRVETASEMRDAVFGPLERLDVVIMTAAVADFRPETSAADKIKKSAGPPELHLVPTPDILAELGDSKGARILVGFAAETGDVPGGLEAEGRRKLEAKGLDLLVVNEVGRTGTGFGSDTNRAAILSASGDDDPLSERTKRELASAILDRVVALLPHGR